MADVEDREPKNEYDDEEDESDEEYELTTRTQHAIKKMHQIFNGKATEEDADIFIRDHREVVTQHAGGRDGTFLHNVILEVYQRSILAINVKPLVKRLIEMYPYLLRITNGEGQTPLYSAINYKRYTWRLVDYMLSSCEDPLCIADTLDKLYGKDRSAKTCLTLAFEKGHRDEVLRNLIIHASNKALELPDGSDRTAFHYAVEYSQCSNERVGVVELLLERDGAIIKQRRVSGAVESADTLLDLNYTGEEDNTKYSVYNEHQRTAKLYLEKLAKNDREAKDLEAKTRRIDQDRAESKPTNNTSSFKDMKAPKSPKSRAFEGRNRGIEKPERDGESVAAKKEPRILDENERDRQRLKEQEAQELKVRESRTRSRHQSPERTKHTKDMKTRPDDQTVTAFKVPADHVPNSSQKRLTNTRSFDTEDERKKREKEVTFSKKSAAKGPDSKVLARNSTKILNMLKLHYMRTRSVRKATSFLYGKNSQENVHLFFDYHGVPKKIPDHVFNEHFGKDKDRGIRLDEVLMYVRFPIVTVTHSGRKAPKPRAAGRQDMEFFFNWLHMKGVRRILRVEVEDSDTAPHSDESIMISLEKIVVEHLDWQKTDLDPRVICQQGSKANHPDPFEGARGQTSGPKSQLREVTLKWSGNNAVLRAWSEAEGLPRLEKLETVNIHTPAYSDLLDTREWVDSNLADFDRRLNDKAKEVSKTRIADEAVPPKQQNAVELKSARNSEVPNAKPYKERKIEVLPREGRSGTEATMPVNSVLQKAGSPNPVTEHDWLDCMDRFAECMSRLWQNTVDLSNEQLRHDLGNSGESFSSNKSTIRSLLEPVVVALIDDGVDCCDSDFSGRVNIIDGKTFDYQDESVGQYYVSKARHGTEMARLILRVCPMASIYSIRLKTHTSSDNGNVTIDATSAALAIEAALDKKAAIISMSWTLPVPADGSEEKRVLDSVLETACKRKVPMFCSSSDRISSTDHYPSAFRRDNFFLIGAAHDDGSAYAHAGKGNHFIFPGVNVNTSGSRNLSEYLANQTSLSKESTGSSIATALAAGLGAMITYCFKASALATVSARAQQGKDVVARSELVKPSDVDRIAEHDVLKTAFSRIGQHVENWRM
ncbi:hypothetical protein FSARC_2984 [Fusarium sarcochroum]|uniref:Peptidase S8/S53 domain-containing protein n=1 Tax=Fusarium sarcochroum TaxID=1208366 RepID=A0A8H4XCA7_9HYPO|nr:hypothetical protein FSARC_2984 [Fusarium sarcochroum]